MEATKTALRPEDFEIIQNRKSRRATSWCESL